jgi:hypothetical protein
MLLAIATFFFLFISSNDAHTQGTVTVDTFTFNKILQNFDIVLAKFDDKFRMYLETKNDFIYYQFLIKLLVRNKMNLKNLLKMLLIQRNLLSLKFQ